MGIKPKTSFRHCIPIRCPRWAASHPTHIPRLPKKKPLRGKKVGFAEKKLRLTQNNGASCGGGGIAAIDAIAAIDVIDVIDVIDAIAAIDAIAL